jgi:hypothetical protein
VVEQIVIPPVLQAQSALTRIDYTDAFRVATDHAEERTAEQWARATVEEAPPAMRASLRRGWRLLGVRLGDARDPRRVLGWRIRHSDADRAVLAADSILGMRAELVFERVPGAVLFATILTLRNPLARAVWGRVAPQHRRVVAHLLTQAERRASPAPAPLPR